MNEEPLNVKSNHSIRTQAHVRFIASLRVSVINKGSTSFGNQKFHKVGRHWKVSTEESRIFSISEQHFFLISEKHFVIFLDFWPTLRCDTLGFWRYAWNRERGLCESRDRQLHCLGILHLRCRTCLLGSKVCPFRARTSLLRGWSSRLASPWGLCAQA